MNNEDFRICALMFSLAEMAHWRSMGPFNYIKNEINAGQL